MPIDSWNNTPSVLAEWIGRNDLINQITSDWNDSRKHVAGLIGFGGEGKSSLARKWVDILMTDSSQTQPDGVFWWGFYENASVDIFLEAALNYLSGGRINPRQVQSSNLRAQIIGAMLGAGRYLFVLDGLEVLQHQGGDQYGLIQSNDLRDLLTFFARPDSQSFCLVTSRAPLLDLMDYTTYTHRDVDRLSEEDGRALLRRLGVKGNDDQLNKVVADWDGHALTLSILAVYLAERFDGDIKHLSDIPIPTAEELRYERVHRVLRRYDEHLSKDEREFLKLFSVFRLPVQESAFEKVFEPLLKSLDKNELLKLVSRLANYRLIRRDEHEKSYTTHPLIRDHYFVIFTKSDSSQQKAAHEKIKDYYISIAGDTPEYPTLDDLKPLIEVVHHACQAGAYDEANMIRREKITRSGLYYLTHMLGAWETDLSLMLEFFPDGDASQEPKVSESGSKSWIINEIGVCLMTLGRLREALSFYERALESYVEGQDWDNISSSYRNLANLYSLLGMLDESANAAEQALVFVHRTENKISERGTLYYRAWINHLLGNFELAKELFLKAEQLNREIYSNQIHYLHSVMGIHHAEHLRRTNQPDYAYRVTKANLQFCEKNRFAYTPGMCHRILGDLDFDKGNLNSARIHYDTALKRAQSESKYDVLIEALLARGRFVAKTNVGATHPSQINTVSGKTSIMQNKLMNGIDGSPLPITDAFNNLNEALNYAVEGGYRIYEADVRVALAWAYLANGDKEKAKQSAERALQMSNEMGYHWGKVDAKEVLERIEE